MVPQIHTLVKATLIKEDFKMCPEERGAKPEISQEQTSQVERTKSVGV